MLSRREWLRRGIGGAAAMLVTGALPASALAPVAITVYKDPGCGCCNAWITHLEANGFAVTAHDVRAMAEIKANLGVPSALHSCHTAAVGGYAIEGHVPADLIHRLLRARPKVVGLAVPGMPMGSPGMEGPRKDPYDVVTFDAKGRTSVFAKR
jgi:hypothetical protein